MNLDMDATRPTTPDDLMRYLDGEMPPEERERVDRALEASTELRRELAMFRALKDDFQGLAFHPANYKTSVWDQVNARVNRPIGWILALTGLGVWMTYGAYVFTHSAIAPWEKMATGAIAIGMLMLLTSVIWEQYRGWLSDPYKDVKR
jgi:ferric-dicitrate binding protein FerR (iron transport regulator)